MPAKRTRLVLATAFLVIASALVPPSAHAANTVSAQPSTAPVGDVATCVRDGGVLGVASIGKARVASANVAVFARDAGDAPGEFSRRLTTQGSTKTNEAGGFYFTADCLPVTFLVKVTGGSVDGKPVRLRLSGLGRSFERGTAVSPVTTLPVEYLKLHGGSVETAMTRVTEYLKVVRTGTGAADFGLTTRVKSSTFSPAKYLRVARQHGGIEAFARHLATKIDGKAHRTFRPSGYVAPLRDGYPRSGKAGTPRTHMQNRQSPAKSSAGGKAATGILKSLAGKALYAGLCANLPQNPATNFACADPSTSVLEEISNQLVGIAEQLDELQQSVNEIIVTLNSMDAKLGEIQAGIDRLTSEALDQQQRALKAEANDANQAYEQAYSAAGIAQIEAQVQSANADLQFLGTLEPVTSFTPVAPGSTNQAICGTMYSAKNTQTGQNPLRICADYLAQMQAFASGANAYYSTMYKGLVGGSGMPQNRLLIWTYQNMLTYGGNVPVSTNTLKAMQAQFGQLGMLMDNAYAMLASAQMFEYTATSGDTTTCSNLKASGTYPATTPITIPDACDTIQTGLFAASVMNAQAPSVSMPIEGIVADPKTNYLWWAYPFDVTYNTIDKSPEFPFYPGSTHKYYVMTDNYLYYDVKYYESYFYTQYSNPACCSGRSMKDMIAAYPQYLQPVPMLSDAQEYNFWIATQGDLLSMFKDLFLVDPSSVAATLSDSGFQGLGTDRFGMKWTHLGVDTGMVSVTQTTKWNSSESNENTVHCSGYPPNRDYDFTCSPRQTAATGVSNIGGVMSTASWDMMTNRVPDTFNAEACIAGGIWGFASDQPYSQPINAHLCEGDTFGLMVDTTAQSPDGKVAGKVPPFWRPYMLTGPSSSGVPALEVPEPTVYSAS